MWPKSTKHIWTSANTISAYTSGAEYQICCYQPACRLWTVKTTPFRLYWIILVTKHLVTPYIAWEPPESPGRPSNYKESPATAWEPTESPDRTYRRRTKKHLPGTMYDICILLYICVICVYLFHHCNSQVCLILFILVLFFFYFIQL